MCGGAALQRPALTAATSSSAPPVATVLDLDPAALTGPGYRPGWTVSPRSPPRPARTPPDTTPGRHQMCPGYSSCRSDPATPAPRGARAAGCASGRGRPPGARRTPRTSPRSNGHHEAAAGSGAGSGGRRCRTRHSSPSNTSPAGSERSSGSHRVMSCSSRGGSSPVGRPGWRRAPGSRPTSPRTSSPCRWGSGRGAAASGLAAPGA